MYNKVFEKLGYEEVVLWEVLHIKKEQELCIEFISTNSKYKQGIRLAIDVGEGYLEIDNGRYKGGDLWEDISPKRLNIKCVSEEGLLSVYNIFDRGKDGKTGRCSQLPYCGMKVEQKENTILYRCEHSKIEPFFDKLVFKIELL